MTETELSLAEVVRGNVEGVRRVIDLGGGERDLVADLGLPPETVVERRDPAETEAGSATSGDLVVLRVEPGPGSEPELSRLLAALGSLGPDGRFVLLLAEPVSWGGLDATNEALAASRAGVVAASPVADADAWAVVVGRFADVEATELRLANRARLGRLADVTQPGPGDAGPVEPATEREIRRLQREVKANQDRISSLESSASYRIGKAAVGAIRTPRKIGRLVPRAKLMWSRRTNPRPIRRPAPGRSAAQAAAAWQEALGLAPERLFLAYSSGPAGPRTGLVVAAIVRDETAATLGPSATVHRLLPNDALMTLERVDPDLVLVETGAFGAGLPWAYVGSAAAVDRDRILAAVLEVAARLGRPSVLWHSPAVPDPVGIQPFKRRFDLVVGDRGQPAELAGWHPGVQLTRFNSHQLDPGRGGLPLFVGGWNPRAPLAERALMERLLAAAVGPGSSGRDDAASRDGAGSRDGASGLEIRLNSRAISGAGGFPTALRSSIAGSIDLAATAGLYRSRRLVIADGLAGIDGRRRALEALACGCRIVSLADTVLATAAGDSAHFPAASQPTGTGGAETMNVEALVAEARALEPLDEARIRPVSRRIFQAHATPVALETLTGRLGLGVGLGSCRRSIAVVAPASEDLAGLLESLKRQVFRPSEVIARTGPGKAIPPAIIEELLGLGITTRTIPDASDGWPGAAAAASSAWLLAWPGTGLDDPNALLDLALAAEASRADAVGLVADAPGTAGGAPSGGFVADLPVEGSLISRELATGLAAGDRLGLAARRGARLFATPTVPDRTGR